MIIFDSCRPRDFLMCTKNRASAGGDKKSGQRYEDVYQVYSNCQVLNGIACYGDRVFVRQNTFQVKLVFFSFKNHNYNINLLFIQIRYTGHYFLTTLLYSILLGFLGLDRFSIGHTGTAIGKLLTLGGLGIWWIVDIVLLITGNLMPEDGSNWTPIA